MLMLSNSCVAINLYLVRHCRHDQIGLTLTGRDAGQPLSSEGRYQADALAEGLATIPRPALLCTSPRLRARQTAEIIGHSLGCEPAIAEALDEIDFGAWTGCNFTTLEEDDRWRSWNEARATTRPPGGESMAEAVMRATAYADHLMASHPGASVVCISHGDVIRGLIAHHLGLSLDHLLRFDVDPGSVSTLVIGPWGGRLMSLNRSYG